MITEIIHHKRLSIHMVVRHIRQSIQIIIADIAVELQNPSRISVSSACHSMFWLPTNTCPLRDGHLHPRHLSDVLETPLGRLGTVLETDTAQQYVIACASSGASRRAATPLAPLRLSSVPLIP
jgi:hypothetical protein